MKLKVIPGKFTVCKLASFSGIDLEKPFVFTGGTDEEKSLVCPTALVPQNVLVREDNWRAFRIEGVLDFSLVGILAKISSCLACRGIGIFAISTFNTDYVFTKEEDFAYALDTLHEEGHTIDGGNA